MKLNELKAELDALGSPEKAKVSSWFFKTGPGQYGEGDVFIGVTLPEQRAVAKKYRSLPLADVADLLRSPVHEHRMTALIILVWQYQHSDPDTKKQIASLYHKNRAYVNNWDLVDTSAPYILGDYLTNHSRNVLLRLAASKSLWDRRIAILSTFLWIRDGDFEWPLKIAEILLDDKEDLIHKAVGWMLREIGKRDEAAEKAFLDKHYQTMPRTTLRYAIEKFSPADKAHYMKKTDWRKI